MVMTYMTNIKGNQMSGMDRNRLNSGKTDEPSELHIQHMFCINRFAALLHLEQLYFERLVAFRFQPSHLA